VDAYKLYAYLRNYGGNNYPHPGSVVYLMDSAVMTMQYENLPDFVDLKTGLTPFAFRPGYMLLKPGASFYGNGHEVQMGYLAAEKRFVNQRYSMTSFPFNYSKANIITTAYDEVADSVILHLSPFNFSTYQYSGAARSVKDYNFQRENSTLWLPVDTLNRTATDGYLMDFGAVTDTVLRFTAFAPYGEYVYTEEDDDKTVYLTQYDHRVAGDGTELDFTRQEDMGWNMKGLPWLVSNYRTDTVLEEGNYQRQMFIPHVFYHMDGAGEDVSEGDRMLTARSWDKNVTMSMGKAFFTQTATTAEREAVIFHLPYYGKNEKASRPILRMRSGRNTDLLTAMPDEDAPKTVNYTYGRDGVKWQSNENAVQLYMLDSKRLSHISLLGAAPTEVDIPLGVSAPSSPAGDLSPLTFSLPEKEAFEGYEYVWLIDYQNKRYTNLLQEDYETEIEPGEHNRRFALRFGGFPKTDSKGRRSYVVFAHDGQLFVRGLVKGDRITVYAPSGQIVHSSVATAPEFTMPLLDQTGYLVQVNYTPHKVLNL
jgi:hypothetical protein